MNHNGVERTPIQRALRTLREKLCMTQQQFSNELGAATISVCRWETSRPPRGFTLAQLATFARRFGVLEVAEVFEKALDEDLHKFRPLQNRDRLDEISQQLIRIEMVLADHGKQLARLEERITHP